jgi:hypothetical protein
LTWIGDGLNSYFLAVTSITCTDSEAFAATDKIEATVRNNAANFNVVESMREFMFLDASGKWGATQPNLKATRWLAAVCHRDVNNCTPKNYVTTVNAWQWAQL